MRPRALLIVVSLGCTTRAPNEQVASADEAASAAVPAPAPPTPGPTPALAPAPAPEPEPEAARTKVVQIEPWNLEITLPDSAGHVFDPGNQWFHAELAWEQTAYLVKIRGPAPRTLAQIPKVWRRGDDMRVLEEQVLPGGSISAAYLFAALAPSDGKAMMITVTRMYVTRPLDARSHVECRVNIEHEATAAVLAASRAMCLSLRPAGG